MKEVRIKPVGVSEIKDERILREAIAEIHRKPTAEDIEYVNKIEAFTKRMMGKCVQE